MAPELYEHAPISSSVTENDGSNSVMLVLGPAHMKLSQQCSGHGVSIISIVSFNPVM